MATAAQLQAERIKQLEKQVPTHKTESLPKRGTTELQAKIEEEKSAKKKIKKKEGLLNFLRKNVVRFALIFLSKVVI